ncbi:ATP synthase subunit I [Sulfodiicoccus acidiphilus]|uniref:A-type ATP synthase subunit I n=1 Tax=Sulfodiicoccus acidiphilus TaxID=1670455 RepID=A0A348B0S6_9CREN|nr:V-type ATP synthase subunit I [Sulfodiicoccus acidiphilus]BBD71778.1 ATP synthase subunit I [Sulfodiicoccus acidiphilus]GGT99147.1 ATP synthase subunit I [Sulfodiicoccus acidiphilus]
MIFPEDMVRVGIFAERESLNQVVSRILRFGMFQPEEPASGISDVRMDEARRVLSYIQEHINKVGLIMEVAGLDKLTEGRMKVTDWFEAAEEVNKQASELENKFSEAFEELGQVRGELEIVKGKLKELEPFKEINISMSQIYQSQLFEMAFGIANETQLAKLKEYDWIATNAVALGKDWYAVLLVSEKGTELSKVVKEVGLRRLESLEGLQGSPSAAYSELSKQAEELERRAQELKRRFGERVRKEELEIRAVLGRLWTVRDAMTMISKARVSEFFLQFEGFTPEKLVKKLQKELQGIATVTWDRPRRYGEKEEPPTYVPLGKAARVFESLTEIYGTPSYWEISPTVFLIVSFPILFALMFPDLGNAIVIFLFALWFRKYGIRRNSRTIKDISLVLLYSSVGAMITGLIARGFFGPLPVGGTRELGIPGGQPGPLPWPIPTSVYTAPGSIVSVLLPFGEYVNISQTVPNAILLSILIGAIALFVSALLGLINAIKKRDLEYIKYDKLPVFLLYLVPIIIFAYGTTDPSNYFGAVIQVLTGVLNGLEHLFTPQLNTPANVLGYILIFWVGLTLLYNWIAKILLLRRHEGGSIGYAVGLGFVEGGFEAGLLLFSNTVSFIRILVFALAHYYILYAFSYMAYLVARTPNVLSILANPLAVVILIIGNLLAIALEGLIVFIQDLRLHFYEMFSKFYEGRGRSFSPVSTYVNLETT